MAGDIFLKIADFKGEATDEKFKDCIEILSYSWGVSNGGSMSIGSGGGKGKASFSDVTLMHYVDSASLNLWKACATGQHINEATLTQRKSGGKQEVFLKIKLTDLLVSSVQSSASEGGGLPTETISLNFTKAEWEYFAQKADGSVASAGKVSYDQKLMKAT